MLEATCYSCNFPIAAQSFGQRAKCPFCGAEGTIEKEVPMRGAVGNGIAQGVEVPTPVFWGLLGIVVGIIAGPTILASTDAGARKMADMATKRLKG